MRMPLLVILFLAFLLLGCEMGNGETEIGIYDLGGLDQEEVIDALNDLDGEDMPLRASASGADQVLVTAPPRVHRALPGLLESMAGGERTPTFRGQRIQISLWLLSTREGGGPDSLMLPEKTAAQLREVLAGRHRPDDSLAVVDELHFPMSGGRWSISESERLMVRMAVGSGSTKDRLILNGEIDVPGERHQGINVAMSPGETVVLQQRRDPDNPTAYRFVVLRAEIQ